MHIQSFYKQSVSHRNYTVELLAFVPFIVMILSGLVMLRYHITGDEGLIIWDINRSNWLLFHKISAGVALALVIWHLIQHSYWIKKFIKRQLDGKYKTLNSSLFIVFTFTVLTSTLSWLVFEKHIIGDGLRGLHGKLGFASMILFFFHIKNYFPFLKKMTIKFISFQHHNH